MNPREFLQSDVYKKNKQAYLSETCEAGILIRGRVRAMLNDVKIRNPNVTVIYTETKHWLSSTFTFRIKGLASDILEVYNRFLQQMAQYC